MVSEGSNYNSELSCGLVETNSKYSLGLAWAGHKFYSIHILLSGFLILFSTTDFEEKTKVSLQSTDYVASLEK